MRDCEKAIGTGSDVARFEPSKRSLLQQIHHFLDVNPPAVPAIVLALSLLAFRAVANNFFTAFHITLIVQQVTIIGTLGVAQRLIILTAGIDHPSPRSGC